MSARPVPAEPGRGNPGIPETVIDAAIGWAVKLHFNAPGEETRRAFEAWRQAAPAHAAAWLRVQSLATDAGRGPAALVADTLRRAEAAAAARASGRRRVLAWFAVGGVAALAGKAAYDRAPWQRLLAEYSTGIAGQRTLNLDDGTEVVLNTDSAMDAEFGPERRLLVLRRGEILVATGADIPVHRPFWVRTPYGALQAGPPASGARFDLRLEDDGARLSVQEGAVRLHLAAGDDGILAQAGQRWWFDHARAVPARPSGLRDDSWAQGVIVAEDARLEDLLAELARYRMGRIACDPRIAGIRVSGVYQVRDTDAALRFLARTHALRVVSHTRFWISVEPATA
ncbi:FecR family protein [Bordetella genomosp. 10]|uniref:FecR family protein n=1 Tax=Bordetella genomosp. 10 TaxID=1416804 RepID=UPI00211AE638|nr:FecR domain-containing protein [Bordetella genomosp. 10]